MKRVSYEDITLPGVTSKGVSAKKVEAVRPLGRDNVLKKHLEMLPQSVLYPHNLLVSYTINVLSHFHFFVIIEIRKNTKNVPDKMN
jgi:hypothetical protein